jgi:2,5-diketo-D-gluconate reductase A
MLAATLFFALGNNARATTDPVAVPTVQLVHGVSAGSPPVLMPVMAGGTGGLSGPSATKEVLANFAAGLKHVHTAFDYYNLPDVGAAVAQYPRADIFISAMTSPCIHPASQPVRNVTDPVACYNLTLIEAESVLHDLKVDAVDLLMLHGPSEEFGHEGPCSDLACTLNAAQWKAYTAFLAAGKTRAIGVSNFCKSCLKCLQTSSPELLPATNQIQLHVGMGADPDGLMSYNANLGIVVQAYEPLAGGDVATNCSDCASIGQAHNKSAAQAGLRWVLDRVPTLAVKTGAGESPQYLQDDLDMWSGWQLTTDELATLDSLTEPKGEAGGRCSWGCTE